MKASQKCGIRWIFSKSNGSKPFCRNQRLQISPEQLLTTCQKCWTSTSKKAFKLASMPSLKMHICKVIWHLLNLSLNNFEFRLEKELPSSFRANERAYVHQMAKSKGLLSKSRGKGGNRTVTIFKKGSLSYTKKDSKITLNANSKKLIMSQMAQNPLTRQERQELAPTSERDRSRGIITLFYFLIVG